MPLKWMPSRDGEVALITGTTWQDGPCLTELPLWKGYIIDELKRRSSSFNLTGGMDLHRIVQEVATDEDRTNAASSILGQSGCEELWFGGTLVEGIPFTNETHAVPKPQ